jgi:hypothetical protein
MATREMGSSCWRYGCKLYLRMKSVPGFLEKNGPFCDAEDLECNQRLNEAMEEYIAALEKQLAERDDLRRLLEHEKGRTFPVEGFGPVPWVIAERAWVAYAERCGRSQSCERIAERGGFSAGEMDMFYPEWRSEVSLAAECADLRRQLTQHVDWLNKRNAQVADLKRQVAEARERAEKAERAFALQRATCETESFREQIRSQLIRDGIEAQATIAQQGETIAALRGAAHRPLPDHGWTCTICRQPLQYVMAGEKVIPMANGTAVVVCPACVDGAVRAALDAGKETRNG